MTYKRNPGYQPGVRTVNEHFLLGIENRNGNSDAKSFQKETLMRMFKTLRKNKFHDITIKSINLLNISKQYPSEGRGMSNKQRKL